MNHCIKFFVNCSARKGSLIGNKDSCIVLYWYSWQLGVKQQSLTQSEQMASSFSQCVSDSLSTILNVSTLSHYTREVVFKIQKSCNFIYFSTCHNLFFQIIWLSYCFSAMHAALRSNNQDWFDRRDCNCASMEWHICLCMTVIFTEQYKIQTQRVVEFVSWNQYHMPFGHFEWVIVV
jgi:hypothetical protein